MAYSVDLDLLFLVGWLVGWLFFPLECQNSENCFLVSGEEGIGTEHKQFLKKLSSVTHLYRLFC